MKRCQTLTKDKGSNSINKIRIKAIETKYKGYRFRSRLEARWAIFFDGINIKWEYEKEGYDLGDLGYYLPDFWLPYPIDSCMCSIPNAGHWLEVKGTYPTDDEIEKLRELSRITNHSGILVVGIPGEHRQLYTHRSGNWGWSDKPLVSLVNGKIMMTGSEFNLRMFDHRFSGNGNWEKARVLARSARFEHGESP